MVDEITMASDLFDPEVLSPIIQNTYQKAMVFMPLADINRNLEGRPGDTLTMPLWKLSGEAKDVKEGTKIPTGKISQDYAKVKVSKFGLGKELTDESTLYGLGNAVEKATQFLGDAIAQGADTKLMNNTLASTEHVLDDVSLDIDGIDLMEAEFDTDDKNPAYTIICSPKTQLEINKAVREYTKGSDTGAQIALTGAVPSALGASIYRTKKMQDDKIIMIYSSDRDIAMAKEREDAQANGVKELESFNTGRALMWAIKRDLLIETDRDKQSQINKIYATQIAAPYVQNPSKVVVGTIAKK